MPCPAHRVRLLLWASQWAGSLSRPSLTCPSLENSPSSLLQFLHGIWVSNSASLRSALNNVGSREPLKWNGSPNTEMQEVSISWLPTIRIRLRNFQLSYCSWQLHAEKGLTEGFCGSWPFLHHVLSVLVSVGNFHNSV